MTAYLVRGDLRISFLVRAEGETAEEAEEVVNDMTADDIIEANMIDEDVVHSMLHIDYVSIEADHKTKRKDGGV